VSVITGGGRGIGRVLAQALADAGAAVGLIARSDTELAEAVGLVTAADGTAAAARADITDQQAVAGAIGALCRRLGPADLLVNNAGVSGPFGDAWQVAAEDWWRAVEINLRGVLLCSRAVLPAMTARGAGRIVNITSEGGVFRRPQASAYSVSKAAVIKFTENVAAEASRSGVRASASTPASPRSACLSGPWPVPRHPARRRPESTRGSAANCGPAAAPSPRWWPGSLPGSPRATRTGSADATFLCAMTWTPSWPAGQASRIVTSSAGPVRRSAGPTRA
jgi:NAD(P)-dependent dehydrogenase (short-subunit alcohol dehydrogenase family)